MKKIAEGWKNIKTGQKIIIIAVIALTIVMIAVVTSVANQVNYAILTSGMTDEETGVIYQALKDQGVDVQAAPGNTILVPDTEVDDLKMQLTADGISLSNEANATSTNQLYLDNAMSFGATDADKQRIYQFQQQTNLTNTINGMSKIDSSTVLLSPAETSDYVWSDGVKIASATVAVIPKLGQTLEESDYKSIQELVSGAVQDLAPENVTVVNQATMFTYAGGEMIGAGGGSGSVANQIEMEAKVGNTLTTQILNLLAPVFGPENLTANVNVSLDFDKKTTESVTLAPPTDVGEEENMGIIVSRKRMQERVQNATAAEGEPGMDPNGGAPVYQEIGEVPEDAYYYQITEDINAEVNSVKEMIEHAQGEIKNISATVILNDENDAYADILTDVQKQISTAVGIPQDMITVSAMPFTQNTIMREAMEKQAEALAKQQQSDLIQRIITIGAILGGIIIAVALVISYFRKKREQEMEQERMKWMQEQEQQEAGRVNVVADEPINVDDLMQGEDNNTLAQLQALVQKNPEGIAQVLRNWLTDDFRR